MPTPLQIFLKENKVFTFDMFAKTINYDNVRSQQTLHNMLAQHIQRAHIIRIKRGLFASIPYGAYPDKHPINPYLIAKYMANDAVIGYHSALAIHGYTYSTSYRIIYITSQNIKDIQFRNELFQSTAVPKRLKEQECHNIYVDIADIQGEDVLVTSIERTLVDVLDRPHLGGGWEEIWRSLNMIERVKIEHIIDYVLLLGNATTVAKVGFYLQQRQTDLKISERYLDKLKRQCPLSPHYMSGAYHKDNQLISDWNLVVPKSLIQQDWEESLNFEPKL